MAVLRSLLSSVVPDLTIKILVRSTAKLLRAFPGLKELQECRIIILEGTTADSNTMLKCLRGASVVYVCIGPNKPTRKVDIAQTAARQVRSALSQIKMDTTSAYERPTVMFNRSLALSSTVQLGAPAPAKKMFAFAYGAVFDDIQAAEAVYQDAVKRKLLTMITIDAPSIMNPESATCTGYELLMSGSSSTTINYSDLGAAIVEIAQRCSEFEGKAVGISATGKVEESCGLGAAYMLLGLKNRLTPF